MVSITVSKKWLLAHTRCSEQKLFEVLPQVKASINVVEGDAISLEITSDRPDLLSRTGVARAVNGFTRVRLGAPKLKIRASPAFIRVEKSVFGVRPIVLGALATNLRFSSEDIAELMQLQEKLTLTHGRRRKRVAIGIHDAAPIAFPLTYKAVMPKEIEFVPLGEDRKMDLEQILRDTPKGWEYAFTLKGFERYPIILDARGNVVSFPPIINGRLTAVTEETTSLFLDVTGTDFEACNVALNVLCNHFSDEGARIHSVTVIDAFGKKTVCPDARPEKMLLSVTQCNHTLGLTLKPAQVVDCLRRQRLNARRKGTLVEVEIPRYRADVLHSIDLIEEVALGYGYNAFEPVKPQVFTKGGFSMNSELVEKIRDALTGAGFLEVSSYVLTNEEKARRAKSEREIVRIRNPVSEEYSALRGSLLPGLLETLGKNTRHAYPQKFFEVGEVVVKDARTETRTRTDLQASAVTAHSETGLSEAASVLAITARAIGQNIVIEKASHPHFIEGRCAAVFAGEAAKGERLGFVGEFSPEVLEKFGIEMPTAGFELTVKKGEK